VSDRGLLDVQRINGSIQLNMMNPYERSVAVELFRFVGEAEGIVIDRCVLSQGMSKETINLVTITQSCAAYTAENNLLLREGVSSNIRGFFDKYDIDHNGAFFV
jgi:hypothetical protein